MSISRSEVLDHGYVSLEAVMGDDFTPVEAARVSTDQGRKGEEADEKLTKFLLRHGHTSPFEMVEMRWEVSCPLFVAREWVRHRTANWNERSLRYTAVDNPEFYHPTEWRLQSTKNKQSSEGVLDKARSAYISRKYWDHVLQGERLYKEMKSLNISNEFSRLALPIGYYTKFWWKNDMKNTMDFLRLREDEGAQQEIREYAEAMHNMLRLQFPKLMKIYDTISI